MPKQIKKLISILFKNQILNLFKYKIFFIFSVCLCSILASINLMASLEGSTMKKKFNTDEDNVLEQTATSFEKFRRHLYQYFAYLDQTAEKEKSNAYGRFLLKHKEQLKQKIKETNATFLNLRENFWDIIFLKHGNHTDTKSEAVAIEAELTAWYITYMKACLESEIALRLKACQECETE